VLSRDIAGLTSLATAPEVTWPHGRSLSTLPSSLATPWPRCWRPDLDGEDLCGGGVMTSRGGGGLLGGGGRNRIGWRWT